MFAVLLISFSFCSCLLRAETIVKDAPANFTATAVDQNGQRVPVSGEMDTIQILDVHRRGDKTYDPGLSIDINVRPLSQGEQWQSTTPSATYVLPGPGGSQPAAPTATAAASAPLPVGTSPMGQPPTWFNGVPTRNPLPQPNYAGMSNIQNLSPPGSAGFTDISDIKTTESPTTYQTNLNYPYTAGGLAPANPTQNFNVPTTAGLTPTYPSFNPSSTNIGGWGFSPFMTSGATAPISFNPFGLPTNMFGFNNSAALMPTATPFPWLATGSNENGFNFGNQFGAATPKYGYNLFGGRTGKARGPNPGDSYFESAALSNDTGAGKSNSTGNATLIDLLTNWLYKGGDNESDYGSEDYDYESQPVNETKVPLAYENTINPSIYQTYFNPDQWNKFTNVTYSDGANGRAKNPFNHQQSGTIPWKAASANNPWFKLNDIKKLPTTDFASISLSQAGKDAPQWSFNASGPDVMEFFKNSTDFNVSTILQDLNMTFKDPMAWTNDMAGLSTVNVEEMPTIFEVDNYGKPINISEIMESVEKALQNLTGATRNNSLDYGIPPDMLNMFSSMDVSQIPLPGNNANRFRPSDLSNGFNQATRSGFNTLSNYSASYGNLKNNASDFSNRTTSSASSSSTETNATAAFKSNDQPADEQSHTGSAEKMSNMPGMGHGDDGDDGDSTPSPNASGLEASSANAGLAPPSWLMGVFVFAGLLGQRLSA